MTRVLPAVAAETVFALKGGTAICFFYRDLPRLSVDIDLTYLGTEGHADAVAAIAKALERIAERLRKQGFKVEAAKSSQGHIHKLFVADKQGRIKIEPNFVLRGTIHQVEKRNLSAKAEELFETAVSMQVVSAPDLYAGKLCAALDRQHPRDLFDVRLLLAAEGITDAIRKAFVIYLASSDRPIHEIITPTRLDIKLAFEKEFQGMTTDPVSLDELLAARETMIEQLNSSLTANERAFLISVKEVAPRWELMKLPGIENLPALQWKLSNIKKMNKPKHAEQLRLLRERLGVS
jgi:hypothetical protein